MWRLIKLLIFITILSAIGLVGYAYIGPVFFPGDFAAPTEKVVLPVTLETQ